MTPEATRERAGPVPPSPGPRGAFLAVLAVAFLHALFYAVFMPAWNSANEPQHLDYVLQLRDRRHIPHIREPIRPDIADAVWRSERWRTFGGRRPESREAALGRLGRSYEGYQPPVYYQLMVPIAALAGADPLRAMYAVRLANVPLLAIMAGLTWALAARWAREGGARTAAGAALLCGAIPVVASSCARVTNDGLTAVLVAGGVLAVTHLIDRPSFNRALIVGFVSAAALLTKSPGSVLLPIILVSLVILGRRGRLDAKLGVAAVAPVAIAWGAWAGFTYARYGIPDGTAAFLALYGRAPAPLYSPLEFVRNLWLHAWVPPPVFLQAGARAQGILTSGTLTAVVVVGVIGCLRRPVPGFALACLAGLVGGSLTILWVGNVQGLVPPAGRVLMVSYPVGAAIVASGWGRLFGGAAALVPGGVAWALALAYELLQLIPLIRPWWFR
jgi:4-amino-4-deoxy-L-arabinose transferase-like glycosyltransferase